MIKSLQFLHELTCDEKSFGKRIEGLRIAVRQVLSKDTSQLSFEKIFADVYIMVLASKGAEINQGLRDVITSFLQSDLKEKILAISNDAFIEQMVGIWADYNVSVNILSSLFTHFDMKYVRLAADASTVRDLAFSSFRDELIRDADVQNKLKVSICKSICAIRNKEEIDIVKFKEIIEMLCAISCRESSAKNVYAEVESAILDGTEDFYKAERAKWLTDGDLHYIIKALKALKMEQNFVSKCLAEVTHSKLLVLVTHVLIETQVDEILRMNNGGLIDLIMRSQTDTLCLMYKTFTPLENGVKSIIECLDPFLRKSGLALIQSFSQQPQTAETAAAFVKKIVELHEKVSTTTLSAFSNDSVIKHSIFGAFRFLSIEEPTLAEHLAVFINDQLKKPMKQASEKDLELLLSQCVALYPYLQHKNIFEEKYKYCLARRLLINGCISDDMEKLVLGTLKNDCSHEFTSKVDCMYTDMTTSDVVNREFPDYLKECARGGEEVSRVKLRVNILTSFSWPFSTENINCRLPEGAYRQFLKFQEFYSKQHPRRLLSIYPKMGNADLWVNYEQMHGAGESRIHKQRYPCVLKVSTYQMCVLMLFNEFIRLSYANIKELTRMEESDLKRTLLSLACAKDQRILLKVPSNTEVRDGDKFSINEAYTSLNPSVQIKAILEKGEKFKPREVCKDFSEDHKYEIDASIIRIMKKEQALSHEMLISSVRSMLQPRFTAELDDIETRIEDLIRREYIARSTLDNKAYMYTA